MLKIIKKFLNKSKTKEENIHIIDNTIIDSNLDIKIKSVKINTIKFKDGK
jgi:hypothetical protein